MLLTARFSSSDSHSLQLAGLSCALGKGSGDVFPDLMLGGPFEFRNKDPELAEPHSNPSPSLWLDQTKLGKRCSARGKDSGNCFE